MEQIARFKDLTDEQRRADHRVPATITTNDYMVIIHGISLVQASCLVVLIRSVDAGTGIVDAVTFQGR